MIGITGSIVLTTLLSLALPEAAPAIPDPGVSCPAYGCTASVLRLFSGGFVLSGEVTVPAVLPKPPGSVALVRNLDTGELQEIGIEWEQRAYFCCCPVDWHGTFADTLTMRVRPGDRLEIVVGADTCFATVAIPLVVAGNPDSEAARVPTGTGSTLTRARSNR